MTIALSDNTPRVSYTVASGITQTTFTVNFEFFDDSDLNFYVDGTLKTLATHYTVTGGSGSTGTITTTAGNEVVGIAGGSTVTITRDVELSRVTDFPSSGAFEVAKLNTELDRFTAIASDLNDGVNRAIRMPDSDPVLNVELPSATARADKIFKFDTEGNIEAVAANELISNTVIGANYTNNTFIGDGSTVAYTTTVAAGSKNNCQIYIDGVYQEKSTFSISTTTLTFTEAPPLNSSIEVIIGNAINTADSESANVNYNQGGTGAQTRTVQNKLQEFVSVSDFLTGDAAALAAFTANQPLYLKSGESAKLVCDPTSGDDIQAMINWMRGCKVSPEATFYLEIADGKHTVNTYIDLDGSGTEIDIRGTASPTFQQITTYAASLVSGTTYEITVTVGSSLSADAVVGSVIGIQNAQGSGEEECFNGAHIVKAIAGDRLTFTFDINSPQGAPSIGTIDNTLTNGLTANQVVIYKSSIIATSTGWDGSAREGFINCLNGGRMTWRFVGLAYSGTAGTEHDLIFLRGSGSRFYAFDYSGFVGAGDKVFRSYGASEIYLNRSQLGGSTTAQELYQGVAGGEAQFVRVSFGSSSVAGFTVGSGTSINLAQSQGGALVDALKTTSASAAIAAYPIRIKHCTKAIEANGGTVYCTSDTELKENATAIDFANGSLVLGNITLANNGTDSTADANVLYKGGVWYNGSAVTTTTQDIVVASSNPNIKFEDGGATVVANINANSGNIYLDTYTTARDVFFQAGGVSKAAFDSGDIAFIPSTDNTGSIGTSGNRWSVIYAATGTINTSDERQKEQVANLSDAELRVATAIKGLIKKFKFRDAVAAKGDNARIHIGVIAQEVQAAFVAESLDPNDYGIFCYDEWEDEFDDDGNQIRTAGNTYGVRYEELLAFVIATL